MVVFPQYARRGCIIICASTSISLHQNKGPVSAFVTTSDDADPQMPDSCTKDCSFYNTINQRLSWAERRNRCNSESNCKFLGRRFTGSCVPIVESSNLKNDGSNESHPTQLSSLSPSTSSTPNDGVARTLGDYQINVGPTPNEVGLPPIKIKHRMYAEIVASDENEFTAPLRVLVHETLTSSAVDSIRDSQQLANELAKCLLIEVLERKENRGKFGELLLYMFISDTVLSPTRELIYWSLAIDNTMKDIISTVKMHRDYWLGLREDRVSQRAKRVSKLTGRQHTDAAVIALVVQWLNDPQSRTAVITPLLDWTLLQHEEVIAPLAALTVDCIPWAKEATVEGIVYALSESLKSEDVRKAAADALVSYFRHGAQPTADTSSDISSSEAQANKVAVDCGKVK